MRVQKCPTFGALRYGSADPDPQIRIRYTGDKGTILYAGPTYKKARANISKTKTKIVNLRTFKNLMPPFLSFMTESDLDSPFLKSTVSWFQR